MRTLAIVSIVLTGCSAIFMEKTSDTHIPGKPVYCTGNKGFVAWDVVSAIAHGIGGLVVVSAAGKLAETTDASGRTIESSESPYVLLGLSEIGLSIAHITSAVKGNRWANECRAARAEYDATIVVAPPKPAPVVMVAKPAPPKIEPEVTMGTKPVYCDVTIEDVGECWRDEAACTGTCEARKEAACFTAASTADKREVCAVTIEDCETRRMALTNEPGYTVSACGFYRVMNGW